MNICKRQLLLTVFLLFPVFYGCSKPAAGTDNPGGNEIVRIPDEAEDPAISGTPLDCRWEISSSMVKDENFSWLTDHICYATAGEGKGKASFSAHSANDKKLICDIRENAAAVGALRENDYILFRVPMEYLPAGTDVDFMVRVNVTNKTVPKDWVVEYFEDGLWNAVGEPVEVKKYSTGNNTTIVKSFRTSKDINKRGLRIRMRVCSKKATTGFIPASGSEGSLFFGATSYQAARILVYPEGKFPAVKGNKKILILGNSFTYYYATSWMLKEIARSQGQQLDMNVNIRAGYNFAQQLELPQTLALIEKGGYDVAIIQDQSVQHSEYYSKPDTRKTILDNTQKLKNAIVAKSPSCKVVLENTWAYPSGDYQGYGSMEAFDKALSEGCQMLAKEAGTEVSPIGAAFAEAVKAGYKVYSSDQKHPSPSGSYLKSCVNYLYLYKTKFDENVSDCGIPAETAKALRKIAEDVVF